MIWQRLYSTVFITVSLLTSMTLDVCSWIRNLKPAIVYEPWQFVPWMSSCLHLSMFGLIRNDLCTFQHALVQYYHPCKRSIRDESISWHRSDRWKCRGSCPAWRIQKVITLISFHTTDSSKQSHAAMAWYSSKDRSHLRCHLLSSCTWQNLLWLIMIFCSLWLFEIAEEGNLGLLGSFLIYHLAIASRASIC